MKKIVLIGLFFLVVLINGCIQEPPCEERPCTITFLGVDYKFQEKLYSSYGYLDLRSYGEYFQEYRLAHDANISGVFIIPKNIYITDEHCGGMLHPVCTTMYWKYKIVDETKIKKFGASCFYENPSVMNACLWKTLMENENIKIEDCYLFKPVPDSNGNMVLSRDTGRCIDTIIRYKISERDENLSEEFCNKIKIPENLRDASNNFLDKEIGECLSNLALQERNEKYCYEIPLDNGKAGCLYNLAKQEKDLALCYEIPSVVEAELNYTYTDQKKVIIWDEKYSIWKSNYHDQCFRKFSEWLNNPDLCDEMVNTTNQSNCHWLME